MNSRNLVLPAAGALALILTVAGQAKPMAAQEPMPSFKSRVDLVRVNATVRDRKGRFVSDLAVTDFAVSDAGVNAPISDFRHDSTGISVALLFDVSGSMESRLPTTREPPLSC